MALALSVFFLASLWQLCAVDTERIGSGRRGLATWKTYEFAQLTSHAFFFNPSMQSWRPGTCRIMLIPFPFFVGSKHLPRIQWPQEWFRYHQNKCIQDVLLPTISFQPVSSGHVPKKYTKHSRHWRSHKMESCLCHLIPLVRPAQEDSFWIQRSPGFPGQFVAAEWYGVGDGEAWLGKLSTPNFWWEFHHV